MKSNKVGFASIDEYITTFPEETQRILRELRANIHASAPAASEKIYYQMPAFFQNGGLVSFAAYQNHIGFYPGARVIQVFESELRKYKTAKGSIQFPIDQPLPLKLISKIVRFRVAENRKKAEIKSSKSK